MSFKNNLSDVERGQLERAIIMILKGRHFGKENAVVGSVLNCELSKSFSFVSPKDTRLMRDAIEEIRKSKEHPICSSTVGYWYAKNPAESEEYYAHIISMIDNMRQSAEAVKTAAKNLYGHEGQPGLF